jgi:hypothetical protein
MSEARITWPVLLASMLETMGQQPIGSVFASVFQFGDCVFMDGDDSLTGAVTALCWTSNGAVEVQVSWLHSGASHSGWFAEHRLTRKAQEGDLLIPKRRTAAPG